MSLHMMIIAPAQQCNCAINIQYFLNSRTNTITVHSFTFANYSELTCSIVSIPVLYMQYNSYMLTSLAYGTKVFTLWCLQYCATNLWTESVLSSDWLQQLHNYPPYGLDYILLNTINAYNIIKSDWSIDRQYSPVLHGIWLRIQPILQDNKMAYSLLFIIFLGSWSYCTS